MAEGVGQKSPTNEALRHAGRWSWEVWGAGYNWLQSNAESAKRLKRVIDTVLAHYRGAGTLNKAEKVMLLTHSMGGMVASSLCVQWGDFAKNHILGVQHIAQPAAGASAVYKRMRAGFEGPTSVLFGRNAREVVAILGKAQGGLELLPFPEFNNGAPWLFAPKEIHRDPGSTPQLRLPLGDPYGEIYTSTEWYGLIPWYNEKMLPGGGDLKPRTEFNILIGLVRRFHSSIAPVFHPNTHAVWSKDDRKDLRAWGTVIWKHRPDYHRSNYPDEPMPGMGGHRSPGIQDDHTGTIRDEYNLVKVQDQADPGDGTVPADASASTVRGKAGVVTTMEFGPPKDRSKAPKPEKDDEPRTGFEHAFACAFKKVQCAACWSLVKFAEKLPPEK